MGAPPNLQTGQRSSSSRPPSESPTSWRYLRCASARVRDPAWCQARRNAEVLRSLHQREWIMRVATTVTHVRSWVGDSELRAVGEAGNLFLSRTSRCLSNSPPALPVDGGLVGRPATRMTAEGRQCWGAWVMMTCSIQSGTPWV